MKFEIEPFKKVIDWIDTSNDLTTRVGLLGGEPTLHPKFLEFLDYILSKKLNTVVFTNGMVADRDILLGIIKIAKKNGVRNKENLCFCLNVNERKYRSEKEQHLQTTFLETLGRVTALSFNIFESGCDFGFLVGLIKQYKTLSTIRFGLAAPLGNRNQFLAPKDYGVIANKLTDFAELIKKQDVSMGFDCGFVRCMFTEEQLEKILNSNVEAFSFDCGPSVDIYPNLDITNCYPMSRVLKAKVDDFKTYNEAYGYFKEKLKDYPPIFHRCKFCDLFTSGECGGGCRAHKANG
jgi:MoaA/NifB/PqqE/SkfB family radical SAM enzyme